MKHEYGIQPGHHRAQTGLALLVITVAIAVAACGGDDAGGSQAADAGGDDAGGGQQVDAATGTPSECVQQCQAKGEPLDRCAAWCGSGGQDKPGGPTQVFDDPPGQGQAGTFSVRFEHDGIMRAAVLHVPESYEADGRAALMLNFHGFGGTAVDHMETADMGSLAERDGFLVAYPQGSALDGSPHWNSALDTPDNKSDADDLGFVRALVARIATDYPFDPDRLYASGYSNGGMMAFALACYASELVAAVGVVSGQLMDASDTCAPVHPTAVITLHGTEDRTIPYEGNSEGLSAQDAVDFWVSYNGTATTPETAIDSADGMTIERSVYSAGRGGVSVEHYRYVGGEHVWFGSKFEGSDASRLVWDFMVRHDIEGAR